jgi:hypothetical protein
MRNLQTALLVLCLSGAPFIVGCDRTVAHDETTKTQSDGTVKHDETTVKQDSNGNTVKEQVKTTDKP